MVIERKIESLIRGRLFNGKAIIVVGARQVGKTTMLRHIVSSFSDMATLELNCDEPEVRQALTSISNTGLQRLIGAHRIVMIDEAQRVPEIGLTLKRIIESFPDVQLLVTGSSSLDLLQTINEPLTGRKFEYHLYPISTAELYDTMGYITAGQWLESRLIFGSYPEIITHPDDAKERLFNLANSYLYKDLLGYEGIRKPVLLEKLLIALALQVGSEVSYNELAQTVGTDNRTIEKYIGLLEQCYVVFQLNAFSRNLRTELKKSRKIYFCDNGIRNAVLQNFAPLALRQDIGALWENFVISERQKHNHYTGHNVNSYFWRTTTRQEIDYIEESNGAFTALEIKWNPKKSTFSLPASFVATYPVTDQAIVTRENYWDWVM